VDKASGTIVSVQSSPPSSEHSKQPGTGAFSKLSMELRETDLKNPVVGRMLLDKIDSLTSEKIELESYRDRYHEADKNSAVLAQSVAGESKFQILYSFCLTVGGVVFGVAFTTQGTIKGVLVISGIVLFLIGIILSLFVNKK
jgi:hypothetical protein